MKTISELGLELIEVEDQALLVDRKLGIKHIASTKPLEGLPLLVIEDNVIGKPLDDYIRTKANQDQCLGFIEGYNKAKETYKFTEEDLRKAIKMSKATQKYKYGEGRVFVNSDESIIQSLIKKELWIEVELSLIKESHKTGYTVEKLVPKIVNNQIKATYR